MKVAQLIEQRQKSWQELEQLCNQFKGNINSRNIVEVNRFTSLYRSACADLALAEAYNLPPSTTDYLHRLVARAHNQLYRSQVFQWRKWLDKIFVETPQLIFNERCVHIAFVIFWGLFLMAAYLSYNDQVWPGFAEQVIGQQQLDSYQEMFTGFSGRSWGENSSMMGVYILNNPSIGLSCFVMMLLVLPGLVTLAYNAIALGCVFGHMFRPEMGEAGMNFKSFVTAHGPLELTAIVLAAGAGLKIGLGWLITDGLKRSDSLILSARKALPIAMCSVCLFIVAALIEGFISPTNSQHMPWWFKGVVAVITSGLLMIYFVVLGYPRGNVRREGTIEV